MNPAMTTAESPLAPNAAPPPLPATAPGKPPRVWKFWATLAWSILLYGVMTVSAALGIVGAIAWYGIDVSAGAEHKSALVNDGVIVAVTSLSATLPVLVVIWLALKLARQKFADYL